LLRSLLIGFLILSALTSNGGEAQSIKSVNITKDMLLELFNTVAVHTGKVGTHSATNKASTIFDANKASGASLGEKRGVLYTCTPIGASKTDSLFGSCTAIWPEYYDYYDCNLLAQEISLMHGQPINSGARYCVSGLSPPCFKVFKV
jgi:hypothetical protein